MQRVAIHIHRLALRQRSVCVATQFRAYRGGLSDYLAACLCARHVDALHVSVSSAFGASRLCLPNLRLNRPIRFQRSRHRVWRGGGMERLFVLARLLEFDETSGLRGLWPRQRLLFVRCADPVGLGLHRASVGQISALNANAPSAAVLVLVGAYWPPRSPACSQACITWKPSLPERLVGSAGA